MQLFGPMHCTAGIILFKNQALIPKFKVSTLDIEIKDSRYQNICHVKTLSNIPFVFLLMLKMLPN